MPTLNHLNDDFGLARDMAAAADGEYLGSYSTVETVIRAYLGEILAARADQIAGKTKDEGFRERVIKRAKWVQDVIYGRVEGYTKARWSGMNLIGTWLTNACGMGGENDDAVVRLMGRCFREFAEAYGAYETDKITEDAFRTAADGIIEFYTHILMMMKPPAAE